MDMGLRFRNLCANSLIVCPNLPIGENLRKMGCGEIRVLDLIRIFCGNWDNAIWHRRNGRCFVW
jgi:hypothetical protein